jgi:post-segregation antitoxin (ccd killing protein)
MNQRTKTDLVSRTAEREKAARDWYQANKAAVDAYNELIEQSGLFSDGSRKF